MNGKTAIVTGSNSGFGLLCSLELANLGYRVIATMRDVQKGKQLLEMAKKMEVEQLIHIHPLDVTSAQSIRQFADMLKREEKIDLLLNNAGFALGGFAEEVTIEEYRLQFETNVFGVIGVTQAVIPLMRKQGAGKIINMSSISGRFGFPGLSPYVASKHALEGYSESLRLELKPYGIDVYLIEPGSYQTNIWTTGMKVASKSLNEHSPYSSYMNKINEELERGQGQLGNPQEIAQLVQDLAEGKKNTFRNPIGKGVRFTLVLKFIMPWKWVERIVLKKLGIKKRY
ncbi:oxidoreductase [Rossellomorea aquimaris]|uniref:oxidoreductase n=1 Tax=Rossellomorea aquimaris TaxID=189382 RepID=UPI0007D05FDD|nr:oxidoreductase [Rossellomorea aquimaris]